MTRTVQLLENGEVITAYGNAKPGDNPCTIRAVDAEIIEWLARREKRRQRHVCSSPNSGHS